jgi:hypothetical protein
MHGDTDATVVYTVGHSTRSLGELAQLLDRAGVGELIDIRSVPHSRRHPHFDRDALARSLPERGVDYTHEECLGGFRRPLAQSPNGGWDQQAVRGYADHMASEEFRSPPAGARACAQRVCDVRRGTVVELPQTIAR